MEAVSLRPFPDLKGSNIFTAQKYLDYHGYKKVRYEYSETQFERNMVVSQNIDPGEEASTDVEVVLTISAANPIKYLPSIFQVMDSKNGDFLKRYLWIFYSLLNTINVSLDNIHRYFNPMESPKDFFPWLVSWFSDYHKYSIPEETLRLVISNIVPLYRWRGTAAGISRLLEIIIGTKPDVMDNYKPVSEYVIENDSIVEKPILPESSTPYFFTVVFPVSVKMFSMQQIQLINDIIKREKPAHCDYYLTFTEERQAPRRDYSIIDVDRVL